MRLTFPLSSFRPWFFLVFVWGLGSCHRGTGMEPGVFRYNMAEGLETLDPAFARNQTICWAVQQLYNTLLEVNSHLHLEPSLAKSWDISPNGLVFTFHLRTDVYFQGNPAFPGGTGRRMTASDIVYSFQRIMDPRTASTGAWIFNGKISPQYGFAALNDSTFRLTLEAFSSHTGDSDHALLLGSSPGDSGALRP